MISYQFFFKKLNYYCILHNSIYIRLTNKNMFKNKKRKSLDADNLDTNNLYNTSDEWLYTIKNSDFIKIGNSVWKKDKLTCCYAEKKELTKEVQSYGDKSFMTNYNKWFIVCSGDGCKRSFQFDTKEQCENQFQKLQVMLCK